MTQRKIRNLIAGAIALFVMPTQHANAEDLFVNGNLIVDNDAYVGGFLDVSYFSAFDAYISGNLEVWNDTFINGSLDVSDVARVNGMLEVTAPSLSSSITVDTSGSGAGIPVFFSTSGTPDATTVGTVLGTTSVSILSSSSGSVLLESNGDVSLSQSDGAEETFEFLQVTAFDIGNAGHPTSPGSPIAGSERFIAGYENGSGEFVALSPEFSTQVELDDWIASADFTDLVFDPIRSFQTFPSFGGNLYVEGSAYIGNLEVDGVPDVAAAISANSQAIVSNAAVSQNDIYQVAAVANDNTVAIDEINAQHQALLQLISEVQEQYAGLSLGGVALNPNGANSLNVEFVIESSEDLETWTPVRTVSETVDTTGVSKQFIRVRAVDPSL